MTRHIDLPPKPLYYAAHCEMQDVAARTSIAESLAAPAAASIELAMLVTQFETSIDDEQRARIIALGGLCIRLANQLDKDPESSTDG